MHKGIRVSFFIFIILILSGRGWSQHLSIPGEDIICYTGSGSSNTAVHLEILDTDSRSLRKKAGNAVFEVTFTNTTSAGRTVFKKATEIWSEIIKTDIPIKIDVTWASLDDNILGSARPSSREINFPGAPQRSVWYPIALAEKIAGTELNDSTDFEINITFNTEFEWSYSLDGEVDSLKHDFLSVALHEIGHGLGLSDSFDVSGTSGSWGIDGLPTIYDTYITSFRDEQLIDKSIFTNGSSNLKGQLTSGRLKFSSTLAKTVNEEEFPRIYSPSEFNGGSSISHLDENIFPAGDENSLMTPQLSRGEVVLGPGEIISQMLADMGYVWTSFDHTPPEETFEIGEDIELHILIEGDSSLVEDELWLYYSSDNFETENKVQLLISENLNEYSATIPAMETTEDLEYYFSATDVINRTYTWPAIPSDSTFSLKFELTTGNESLVGNNDQLWVYPNPTRGNVHIEADFNKPVTSLELLIFNVHGDLIFHERSIRSSTRYSRDLILNDMPPGIYFLQIRTEETMAVRKLILE